MTIIELCCDPDLGYFVVFEPNNPWQMPAETGLPLPYTAQAEASTVILDLCDRFPHSHIVYSNTPKALLTNN